MARGSAGESVLHKHLRILESFDAWHPFLTLTEIADATGLAPSSAHRLIAELEREAYALGFESVAAGPLVRSSYHADEQVPVRRARSFSM